MVLDYKTLEVLVVDDQPIQRGYVKRFLSYLDLPSHALNIQEAEDGKKALEILAAGGRIDVAITDYNMPNKNGLEVVAEGMKISPQTYFVVRSGMMNEELAAKVENLGAKALLKEDFEGLLETVRQYITNKP